MIPDAVHLTQQITLARSNVWLRFWGGSHRRYAHIGDVIKVTVKEAIPRGKGERKVMF